MRGRYGRGYIPKSELHAAQRTISEYASKLKEAEETIAALREETQLSRQGLAGRMLREVVLLVDVLEENRATKSVARRLRAILGLPPIPMPMPTEGGA